MERGGGRERGRERERDLSSPHLHPVPSRPVESQSPSIPFQCYPRGRVESNRIEWSEVEWSKVEWSGVEQSRVGVEMGVSSLYLSLYAYHAPLPCPAHMNVYGYVNVNVNVSVHVCPRGQQKLARMGWGMYPFPAPKWSKSLINLPPPEHSPHQPTTTTSARSIQISRPSREAAIAAPIALYTPTAQTRRLAIIIITDITTTITTTTSATNPDRTTPRRDGEGEGGRPTHFSSQPVLCSMQ